MNSYECLYRYFLADIVNYAILPCLDENPTDNVFYSENFLQNFSKPSTCSYFQGNNCDFQIYYIKSELDRTWMQSYLSRLRKEYKIPEISTGKFMHGAGFLSVPITDKCLNEETKKILKSLTDIVPEHLKDIYDDENCWYTIVMHGKCRESEDEPFKSFYDCEEFHQWNLITNMYEHYIPNKNIGTNN
jgi:hypothetical protein